MMAESFDCVTIFYGEIVAFDKLISDCKADEVGGRKSDKMAKKRWVELPRGSLSPQNWRNF